MIVRKVSSTLPSIICKLLRCFETNSETDSRVSLISIPITFSKLLASPIDQLPTPQPRLKHVFHLDPGYLPYFCNIHHLLKLTSYIPVHSLMISLSMLEMI